MVLVLLPCLLVLYILFEKGVFTAPESIQTLTLFLLLLLPLAGISVLSQTFNNFITRLDGTGRQLEIMESDLKEATANALRAEEALSPLKKAIDIMQIGVTITDMQRNILYTNQADARMHGYSVEELIGRDARIFAPPSLRRDMMPRELDKMTSWSRECINCRKDGSLFPVRVTSDVVRDAKDSAWSEVAIVTTCEDISERKCSEDVLRLRQRVIESSSNGIMVTDCSLPDNPIIYVNPSFERITGYPAGKALGSNVRFLLGDEENQTGFEEIRTALLEFRESRAVLRNFRMDGSMFWNDLSVSPVQDEAGKVSHFVWEINDVTEREQHEELLEHQASHDALTGLPNRNLLVDRLAQTLANARRYDLKVAVMFIDLDNFKFVNDSLGHAIGDRLLMIEAGRLQNYIRSVDTVARYGGDEFVIVLSNLERSEDAALVAQNIQGLISRPITIDGHEFGVSCSIGISLYPKDGNDVDSLMKNADAAMYRAKEHGRKSFNFYTSEMNDKVVERMTIERHLRYALKMEEFDINYQPQVDLASGRITGVEALLRWRSSAIGMVAPDRFIPLAEETGLIVPIGEWVLKTCCMQNKAWQDAGFPQLPISVNISPRQFQQGDLTGLIDQILKESRLEACFLELEIVESMVMHDIDNAESTMNELKKLGVLLAMDDFGTGFSSLSCLKRFPFDKLKIDLSFIRDIIVDNESAEIVRTIIAMAHSLSLRVVAEGVESEEQMKYLRRYECDEIQGHYFSPPVSAADFGLMLLESKKLQLPEEFNSPAGFMQWISKK